MTPARPIPPPIPTDPRAIVSQEQVWYHLRVSREELREARITGKLRYRCRGRSIQYQVGDVEEYIRGTFKGKPATRRAVEVELSANDLRSILR